MTEWTRLEDAVFANLQPNQIFMKNRVREKYEDLDILAQTIREKGLIQPIAVQATEDPKKFRLLAGGRRFSAMVLGQILPIPARIFPADLSELDRKEIELFENVYRIDLSWQEKGKLTRAIHEMKTEQFGEAVSGGTGDEKRGHSMEDTGKLLNKDRAGVSRDIALADALDEHPELNEAKNESEARRMLRRIRRKAEDSAATQEFDRQVEADGMEKTLERLGNSYITGDFFEKTVDLPDSYIQLVEIDPPYAIDLLGIKKVSTELTNGYTEVEEEEYEDFLRKAFQISYRVMMKSGWLICWHAFQWQQRVRGLLEETGFSVAPVPAFWVKPIQGQTNQPEYRLGSVVEPFFYARKGNAVIRKPGRNNCFDYHPVPDQKKIHPTERPIEMMQDILETFCPLSATLMVPFLGSGNTMLAAANLGIWPFGFDLDKDDEYRSAYVRRVTASKPGSYTSYSE